MRGCAAGCAVGGANIAPPAHPSPPAPGRGGPPPTASRDSAAVSHHPPCLAGAVTLSDENARSRFRACVQPAPAGLRPAAGRSRARPGVSERMPSLRWSRWETYAGPWRTLLPAGRPIPAGYAPRGASRPQQPRPTGPPTGEWSGQTERMRFARLIHRPVRVLGGPAARAACGGNLSLTWLPRMVGDMTKGLQVPTSLASRQSRQAEVGATQPAGTGWKDHLRLLVPLDRLRSKRRVWGLWRSGFWGRLRWGTAPGGWFWVGRSHARWWRFCSFMPTGWYLPTA
jgi:hypothetical protein